MSRERVELGFGDTLDEFNPTDWSPAKSKAVKSPTKKEDIAKVAAVSGFQSREPKPVLQSTDRAGDSKPRRRRTGRNVQFNLKAKPETIEAYCAIADEQGWGLGETLEHAVALLEEKYPR